jgi:hypothetical protein
MGKVSLRDCTHLPANGCRCQAWREQGPGLAERFTDLQFHRRQRLSEASTMPHRVEDGRRCRHDDGRASDVDSQQQQAPACADADLQVTRDPPRSVAFSSASPPCNLSRRHLCDAPFSALLRRLDLHLVVSICRAPAETRTGGTAGRSQHRIADFHFPGPFPPVWSTSIRGVQDSHSTLRLMNPAAGASPGD